MTPDDIIRMAQEAGMPPIEITSNKPVMYPVPDAIERFADLVAAAERKECADLCKYVYTEVLDDREGVAKLCEGYILGRNSA